MFVNRCEDPLLGRHVVAWDGSAMRISITRARSPGLHENCQGVARNSFRGRSTGHFHKVGCSPQQASGVHLHMVKQALP